MLTNIIFDYDGTLVDSLSIYLKGFEQVFSEFGITVTEFEIAENCFGTIDGAKNLGVTDTQKFYKRVDLLISEQISHPPLFNNVIGVLNKLVENNIKLSIVSSSSQKNIREDLRNKGIFNLFIPIITGDDVSVLKPDPEGILKVIDYFKLPKENFLMIGDSKKDIMAAKNAGIKSCLFYPIQSEKYYKYNNLVEKYKPDFVIKDFEAILKLI